MGMGGHLPWLLRKQNHRCYYCNEPIFRDCKQGHPQEATVDHRTPLSRGGSNNMCNLVAACFACNNRKADRTAEEFLAQDDGGAMSVARLELWAKADALRVVK